LRQHDWYELFRLIELKHRITHTIHIYYNKKRILSIFFIMLYILLLQMGSFFTIWLFLGSPIADGLVEWKKVFHFIACFLMASSFIIVLFLVLWILKYTKLLFHKGPAYTISREGIMYYQFGLIGWHQIADIETNSFMSIDRGPSRSLLAIFIPRVIRLPLPHVIISHKHSVQYFKGIFRSVFGTRRLLFFVPLIHYECFENES
jgi:hypothetical protein